LEPQEDSYEDDIIQDSIPVHTAPPLNNFLPWHRVKKQYVRQFQWGYQTSKMIKDSWRRLQNPSLVWTLDETSNEEVQAPDNSQTLKCLVIPGQDLLDIRALRQEVGELNCYIRYLGFNESHGSDHRGTRIHVANNSVTSFSDVSRDSLVLHDKFESIAKTNSQAYRYLKECGPYHVVNLDFCGSVFPNTVTSSQEYYKALHQLLIYQFEHQTSEWLLFITTRIEPNVANDVELQNLCRPARANFDNHPEFATSLEGLIPTGVFQVEEAVVDIRSLDQDQMIRMFGVALSKWLLTLCQSASPKWSIALRSFYRYSINEDAGSEMVSLAFEFTRNIVRPVDPTGMSQLQTTMQTFPTEMQCAVSIAQAISRIRNVDQELNSDSELKIRLRDAQADLLQSAGYDRDAYIQWVNDGETITEN
jgi:hypothetical protein